MLPGFRPGKDGGEPGAGSGLKVLDALEQGDLATLKVIARQRRHSNRAVSSWRYPQGGRVGTIPYILSGATVLQVACYYGHLHLMEWLVFEYGSKGVAAGDVTSDEGKYGGNCMFFCMLGGHMGTISTWLSNRGLTISPSETVWGDRDMLDWACIGGNLPTAKTLVERGFDPKKVDKYGNNRLHLACTYGTATERNGLIDFLVDTCKLDPCTQDSFGSNCLHLSSFNGHLSSVRHLVEAKGLSPEAKGPNRLSAAAMAGHPSAPPPVPWHSGLSVQQYLFTICPMLQAQCEVVEAEEDTTRHAIYGEEGMEREALSTHVPRGPTGRDILFDDIHSNDKGDGMSATSHGMQTPRGGGTVNGDEMGQLRREMREVKATAACLSAEMRELNMEVRTMQRMVAAEVACAVQPLVDIIGSMKDQISAIQRQNGRGSPRGFNNTLSVMSPDKN